MVLDALVLAKCFSCAFFGVLFLQSGFDKVVDREGNLEYLRGHFAKSPLAKPVPLLLGVLTLLEVATGSGCAFATYVVFAKGPHWIPVAAISSACFTLLCLFAGQRLAKDYAGAASLTVYFGVALFSLYLMAMGFDLGMPT